MSFSCPFLVKFPVTAAAEETEIPLRVLAARGEGLDMMIVQVALSSALDALPLITDGDSDLDILRDVTPLSHTVTP